MFRVYADGNLIYFPVKDDLVILSPKLSLEMGKAGSFQFGLPPTNPYYSSLRKIKTIITVEYDDVEIFRGRILTMNRGFNNVYQVQCEGDLAYLVDTVQKGVKYKGKTHALFRKIIDNHNSRVQDNNKKFTVGEITVDDRDVIISGSSEKIEEYETKKFKYEQIVLDSIVDDWVTTFDYIQDTIIEYCGGYLRTRRVGNTTYIDLLKEYDTNTSQTIEFGKNLIDLSQEVKTDDLYTVMIPLGDDNLTIKKIDGSKINTYGGRIKKVDDELIDVSGVEVFGRIIKTQVFDNVNNVDTLYSDAVRMLLNHENMPVTITAKAVDFHLLDSAEDPIYVGNKVKIKSIPHDILDTLTCTKVEYDLSNHANDTYTFGNPKQTMTQRYKKDKDKSKKNSRSSSSRGGGAAGAAASEELDNFTKNELGDKIDAWLNVDKDQGHINLGAFYKDWTDDRNYLTNTVGIDLDSKTATITLKATHEKANKIEHVLNNVGIILDAEKSKIDIYTDHKKTTATETLLNDAGITIDAVNAGMNLYTNYQLTDKMGKVLQNNLGINLDGSQGTINIFDDHKKTTDTVTLLNNAGITLDAVNGGMNLYTSHQLTTKMENVLKNNLGINLDAPGGKISIFSEWENVKQAIKSAARFETMANGIEAKAGMFANFEERIGSVEVTATKLGSTIDLKADTVTVDTKVLDAKKALRSEFKTIIAEVVNADYVFSGTIQTNSFISAKKEITSGTRIYAKQKIETGGDIFANGNKKVATQEWVKEQLKNYASSTHKHTVNIRHVHTVNGVTTSGVTASPDRDTGKPK